MPCLHLAAAKPETGSKKICQRQADISGKSTAGEGRKEFVLESFIEYEVKNCPVGAGQFFVIVAKNSDVATETDWKAM